MFDRFMRDPTHRLLSVRLINIEDLQLPHHNMSIINLEKVDLNNQISHESLDNSKSIKQEIEKVEQRTGSVSGKRNFNEVDNNIEEANLPRKRKFTHSAVG